MTIKNLYEKVYQSYMIEQIRDEDQRVLAINRLLNPDNAKEIALMAENNNRLLILREFLQNDSRKLRESLNGNSPNQKGPTLSVVRS